MGDERDGEGLGWTAQQAPNLGSRKGSMVGNRSPVGMGAASPGSLSWVAGFRQHVAGPAPCLTTNSCSPCSGSWHLGTKRALLLLILNSCSLSHLMSLIHLTRKDRASQCLEEGAEPAGGWIAGQETRFSGLQAGFAPSRLCNQGHEAFLSESHLPPSDQDAGPCTLSRTDMQQ